MLVVYRTNKGFKGRIVALDRSSSTAEMERWIAESEEGRNVAYAEIDERLVSPALLADLAFRHEEYRVDPALGLTLGGQRVALGYKPEMITTARGELREDGQLRTLLSMTDAELAVWLSGRSQAQNFALAFRLLRYILRAAALVQD